VGVRRGLEGDRRASEGASYEGFGVLKTVSVSF